MDHLRRKVEIHNNGHAGSSSASSCAGVPPQAAQTDTVESTAAATLPTPPVGHLSVLTLLCAACEAPLARESSVFQVPGAQGTVGAYVNPHG